LEIYGFTYQNIIKIIWSLAGLKQTTKLMTYYTVSSQVKYIYIALFTI